MCVKGQMSEHMGPSVLLQAPEREGRQMRGLRGRPEDCKIAISRPGLFHRTLLFI